MKPILFFLGFEQNKSFEQACSLVNPYLRKRFIDDSSQYLSRLTYKEQTFIGKYISPPIDKNQLTLLTQNIISLVMRMIPTYSINPSQLILIPCSKDD